MYMLDKDTAIKLSKAVASSYYQDWVKYYKSVLKVTRDKRYRNNNKVLLGLQYKIAKNETNFWDMLREGRQKAHVFRTKQNLNDKEKKELAGLEEHIFIHEQCVRMSRTICDGIAWRCTKYNRTFLNSSSRGFGAGEVNINNKAFNSEFNWAWQIATNLNSVTILNDLTRFLRIGDITEIQEGIPFIHEIKKYGKKVKNMFTLKKGKLLSLQEKRLLQLQRIALKNEAIIDKGTVGTRYMQTSYDTHIGKIEKLIKKSKDEIIVHEELEPFLTVEITNFLAIKTTKTEIDMENKSYKAPESNKLLIHSNWDSFYTDSQQNFLRAAPPYSVFPLTTTDCINLISGNYLVKTYLNISKLEEELKKHGYEIIEITEQELDDEINFFATTKNKMFGKDKEVYADYQDEPGVFTIVKGPFSLSFTASIYTRFTFEYMTFECFLTTLDEMYKIAKSRQKGDMYFPQFRNEKDFWN